MASPSSFVATPAISRTTELQGTRSTAFASIVLYSGVGLVAAATNFLSSGLIPLALLRFEAYDVWFQADLPRVFTTMTETSHHARTYYHPLFGILTQPPIAILRATTGFDPVLAARTFLAAAEAAWACLFFSIALALGLRRLEGIVLTLVAVLSAAALFWWAVPETYGMGSLALLLALRMSLNSRIDLLPGWSLLGLNLLAIGTTVTNGLTTILLTLRARGTRYGMRYVALAALLVISLWGVQKLIYRDSGAPLTAGSVPSTAIETPAHFPPSYWSRIRRAAGQELQYIQVPSVLSVLETGMAFATHSIVAPQISYRLGDRGKRMLSFQHLKLRGATPIYLLALALWIALLAGAVRHFHLARQHHCFRFVLAASLLGQLLLHIIYGPETFLYGLHYAPLLVILIAFAFRSRRRHLVLLASICLFLALLGNNLNRFHQATNSAHVTTVTLLEDRGFDEQAR